MSLTNKRAAFTLALDIPEHGVVKVKAYPTMISAKITRKTLSKAAQSPVTRATQDAKTGQHVAAEDQIKVYKRFTDGATVELTDADIASVTMRDGTGRVTGVLDDATGSLAFDLARGTGVAYYLSPAEDKDNPLYARLAATVERVTAVVQYATRGVEHLAIMEPSHHGVVLMTPIPFADEITDAPIVQETESGDSLDLPALTESDYPNSPAFRVESLAMQKEALS